MAHLIHAYGNYLGIVPTEKPILNDKFFPLPSSKYIVIHNDNKLPSKFFDYFEEVVALAKPILHQAGYQICQVGGPNDPKILGVDNYYLGLSWGQSFFLIKNASLGVCIDSVIGHACSAYDVPVVSLFSHIYPNQAKPVFSDKVVCLEPDLGDKKPSYSAHESPKTIRTIKVETIVQSVFDLLEIKVKLNMKTLHIGENYHEKVYEIIPDFLTDNEELKKSTMHFRMDLKFDEKCLAAWLSHGYKVNVISDKALNLNLLRQFKANIARITLIIKNQQTFSPEYLKTLKAIGVSLVLIAETDKNISELREKLFDFAVESDDEIKPLDNIPKTAKFWTKKIVLSNGQKYPSIAHWHENFPLTNENKIVDCGEFWKDKESFYFYE
jgi:hypothetical protein